MRVLTVSNLYPPAYSGGYEINCRGVVQRLRAEGHACRVLVGNAPIATDVHDDPDVHRVLHTYWRDGPVTLGPRDRVRLERGNAATLRRQLTEFAPDVVAWWGMSGMSLSLVEQVRRAGIPAVAFVCDDWLNYAQGGDLWMRMFARRRGAGRAAELLTGLPSRVDWSAAARYVFVSEFLRGQAPALARTAVEHPGIDPEFQSDRPVTAWGGRLLAVARLDRRKGLATAIEALASLPSTTLTIAGGGSPAELARLQELAARQGVAARVAWPGPLPRAELPSLYARHDAVLFPVVWEEPFGLVPLEAMGIGRPVVATGRGGSSEYLRDGENCLLHVAEDAAGLAAAVQRLASDPELRDRLRGAGLTTAARLTAERYERAAIDHLQDAADARQSRSSAIASIE